MIMSSYNKEIGGYSTHKPKVRGSKPPLATNYLKVLAKKSKPYFYAFV